ncbi:hypothetical protein [Ancylomarina euxinus]|nr:hypothetical protein [Ancylomarina euxinus]MCZ4696225.1 hypothetical protein [Ancylomarina euxinus]MUP16600.1 hypothetical protein [Ancylomarina euxinus]
MKYLSLLALCLSIMSCNFTQSDSKKQKTESAVLTEGKSLTLNIEQVMAVAADKVGEEIHFKGVVNHVCAHSGKRCILKNAEGNLSIRVEATGDLEGFNKEIAGNDLLVTGILREKRLATSEIDEWETDVKEKHKNEDAGKQCSSEMANIKEMRDWMKANNKDYYAIYYVDGTSYEVVE